MPEPWTYTGQIATLGHTDGTVTLVEGTSFCLSGRTGNIVPDTPHGLFFLDTRFLSRFELRVNGHRVEPLTVAVDEPFAATFLGRSRPQPGRADSSLVVIRRRWVGRGLREEITLRNYSSDQCMAHIEMLVDVDFADLFEVKEDRVGHRGTYSHELDTSFLRFGWQREGRRRTVTVGFSRPASSDTGSASWRAELEPRGEWSVCIDVVAHVEGVEIEPRYRCGQPVEHSKPVRRIAEWREQVPQVVSDHPPLDQAVARAAEDLGALRIFDPEHPDRVVIAAGAPWFMTLFGRDSIIASWMALLADPDLALGVLETLARFQGEKVDADTEEEPGRILHEMRFGMAASLSLGGGTIYYGTADTTSLFVMLLGELRRWGLGSDVVERLLPHADRALDWIGRYGDRDGDGYVEYQRFSAHGLANQGWKDSWDGIRNADGSFPEGPIALCEVQAYTYAAYVARAHFAQEAGDTATFETYRRRAADLKAAFNRDFWIEDRGWYAQGLDGAKRPIDSLTSNMGQCLWTGIIDRERAPIVAARLMDHDVFSGWGVRTLASSMAAYNPVSYHNGSVWPHDNALIASGLMRYGFVEEAHRIIEGMLDVAWLSGGRLPELFSGLGRDEISVPGAYPTSCVPQAWAAAAPLMFVRTMLRLDPWVTHGRLWLAPALPSWLKELRVQRVPMGKDRIDITVDGSGVYVDGLNSDVEVVHEPRTPLTATIPRPR